jgi:copper chaperone NosL
MRGLWSIPLVGLLLLLSGCGGDAGSGPIEVKWDRDACERCRMVLSSPQHAAQVRYRDDGGRSRVRLFDDIGCAVIWLEEQPWKDAPGIEIWVADHRDGRWLDARKAFYVTAGSTPMEYGLGAQAETAPGALGFEQAKAHIFATEEQARTHGAHLLQRLEEQAAQRRTEAH